VTALSRSLLTLVVVSLVAGGLAWLLLGARDRPEPGAHAVAGPSPRPNPKRARDPGTQILVKRGEEMRAVVAAPCPSTLAYAVDGARRVRLAWGLDASDAPARARFEALLEGPHGRTSLFVDELRATGTPARVRWRSREIALPAGAETGKLLLQTQGRFRKSFWAVPVFSERPARAPARQNVVLVSLDTVRADHLNAYGYRKRRTSPEFDAWAEQGTLLENAVSAAPGTLSSQMSILTGRYPSGHGVSYANWRLRNALPSLPADVPTLAERLRASGLATAAFTGSGYFALPLGYARGFDEFISTNDGSLGSAASVFEKAFAWLERQRHEAFFLFLHTYEAHEPYLDHRFVDAEHLGSAHAGLRNEALYDGDIRRADIALGRLRRHLEHLGIADRTLVVIVSDHGEEFGDRFDVWVDGHGHGLFQEQVHVPMLAVGPTIRQGLRVAQPADLTAVAPTLLEFLGVEPPPGMEGRSLLDLLRGREASERPERLAFSEDVWIGPARRAVFDRDWKLIEQGEDLPERFLDIEARRAIQRAVAKLDARLLFHLPSDPGERRSRAAAETAVADRLAGHLHERRAARPAGSGGEIPVEGDALERLRSLGYVE
jgi:arylsulfatase A-like enzyme